MINVKMQSQSNRLRPKITVIGVGGAGGNAVNNMIYSNLEGCDFLVCNTDAQALEGNAATHKIQMGVNVTRGLGAGANPEIGRAAAEESIDDIMGYLEGANMVFVTAGMGGGTGTGAAAVIAQAARSVGILTIGVVTKPFHFEGTHRMKLAESGIAELQKHVDTLIIIPNQNLFRIANEKTTFSDAFRMADEVLQSGVRGVTDLMVMPGQINLDFADVRAVMAEMGKAMMGTGEAEGEKRAVMAAEAAISNPLLDDVSMKGARGILVNVIGGGDLTLFEIDEAVNRIREEVDPDANIIFGSTLDASFEGKMRVSVVATGIDLIAEGQQPRPVVQQVQQQQQGESHRRTGTGLKPSPVQQQGGYQGAGAERPRQVTPTYMPRGAENFAQGDVPASILPSAQQQPAQPVARSAAPVMAGGTQEDAPQQPQQKGHAEASQPAYTQAATARKFDTAEQASWQRPAATQTYQRPVPSPAQGGGAQLRGTRMGDTFIPPKPADPHAAGTPATGDLFGGAAEEETLSAPAKQAPAAKPKKSPSLFERFTMQRKDDKAPPVQAETRLSVEDGGQQDEDELDIPAFLRRQAN
ncbi:MAG: cell division protein FtsZ [Alphaproteobacteria bacterium]|nr:cell division protein FtsZ [Alphaproteobacteria bacterium]